MLYRVLGVLPSPPGRVLTTGLSCAISNASHNMLSVAFISGSRLKLNTRQLDHIELLYQFSLPQKSFISTAILLKPLKWEKSYSRFREKTAMINNIWMLIHACMSFIRNVNLGEFGLWNHNSSVKFQLIMLNKSIFVFYCKLIKCLGYWDNFIHSCSIRFQETHRMVPLNKKGSCRIIEKRDLSVCRGIFAISMSSMIIRPVGV